MIKKHFSGMYAEEFNGYLNSRRKKHLRESEYREFHSTYLCDREELLEEEEKEFPGCKCICFRIPGYTVGHLIVDDNLLIKKIVVYERDSVHAFEPSWYALQEELNRKFLNTILK